MGDENPNAFASLRTDCAFDNSGDRSARQVTKAELMKLNTSSLLIESLIEQWCNSLDANSEVRHKLYLTICEKLFQKKLIDDSFRHDKFKFMRNHYQKAFFHVINVAKNTQPEITNQQLMLLPRNFQNFSPRSENLFQWSRYRDDFEELEFIARGGFGQVYKAKNKLDNGIYAVKKISLSYSDVNAFLRSLHEVQMLAKLNHPNIVSYKAAWLEPVESQAAPPKTSKVSDDVKDEMPARLKNDISSVVVFRSSSNSNSNDNKSPKQYCSNYSKSSCNNHSGSSVSKSSPSNHSRSSPSNHSRNSLSSHSRTSPSNHVESSGEHPYHADFDKGPRPQVKSKSSATDENKDCQALCQRRNRAALNNFQNETNFQDSAILFIQMQLCKQTLRQWLLSRNRDSSVKPLNMRASFKLFEQIISGVEYIHSKNIVHHDIKPSNIFISDNFQVAQVGDFGLACLLSHSPEPFNHDASNFVMCPLQQHQFGTKYYAAPEQLQGICTPKSDIFSLGIVLFELLYPFKTEMERVEVIGKLQIGFIAPEFQSSSPEIAHIIRNLINKDPNQRPTAKELLILVKNLCEMHSANFKLLNDKNKIIDELRNELESKDKIISDLQEKLRLYEEAEKLS